MYLTLLTSPHLLPCVCDDARNACSARFIPLFTIAWEAVRFHRWHHCNPRSDDGSNFYLCRCPASHPEIMYEILPSEVLLL